MDPTLATSSSLLIHTLSIDDSVLHRLSLSLAGSLADSVLELELSGSNASTGKDRGHGWTCGGEWLACRQWPEHLAEQTCSRCCA